MRTDQKKVLLGALIIAVGGSVPLVFAAAKIIVLTKLVTTCGMVVGMIGVTVALDGAAAVPIKG